MAKEDDSGAVESSSPSPLTLPDQNQPASAKPYEVSTEKATLNAIERLWFVGPWAVVVFRKWGWRGLLLVSAGFVAGAILMTCLFAFSVMPAWLVPEKYRGGVAANIGSAEPPAAPPAVLEIVDFPRDNWPGWLHVYSQTFDRKSDSLLDKNKSPIISIVKLKSSLPTATKEFIWRLDVESNHGLQEAEGFRLTGGGQELMETLVKSGSGVTHIKFRVGACTKGDTLVAVILLTKHDPSQQDLPKFQSTAYVPKEDRR